MLLRLLNAPRFCTNYRLHLLPAFTIVVLLFLLLPQQYSHSVQFGRLFATPRLQPRQAAANATLGFQRLLTLSTKASWRTRGLLAAANLTGLHFTIPTQPRNPEVFVSAFEEIGAGDTITPKHGSATAWVAHLDLLKYVIASDFESAFIVEDDVDFDVRIKDQVQLISDQVRNFTNVHESDPTPYGLDWDVLWLGHCGSMMVEQAPKSGLYTDETVIPHEFYNSWSAGYVKESIPEGHRQLQASTMTVCSFGYGVTRQSAQKILSVLARGGDEAFDVALTHRCKARDLRCIVVNPEIMHHYEPSKDLGYVSPVDSGDGEGIAVKEEEFEFVKGRTVNIVQSARCKALFNETCS